jgi:hypothetical protein
MFTKPPLRVSRLIAQETARALSINRLAELIRSANEEAGTNCRVSGKMLKKIRDNPEKVGLSWSILVALHTYFKKHGASLQHLPILETRGVLEVLVDARRLVFLLGAKPRPEERRTDLSRWDTRSHTELLTQATQMGMHRKLDSEDVLWRSPVDPVAIRSESWYRVLDDDQASVVSIGSPLAALSSEIMLARMFGVQPFETPHFKTGRPVPFYFAWRPLLAEGFHSAFGLTPRELQADHPELAGRVERDESSAFILEGTPHESRVEAQSWTMHGIIAAQRRAAGNVWLVVSGLAGPATFGTATMVKHIITELPWSAKGPSQVLWVPVKVHIRAGNPMPLEGDIRVVVHSEFDGDPRIWPGENPA